jgi:hypothetical protein
MEFSFWLGLLLSIPISIAVNLWTPRLQLYLDKRQETVSFKRKAKLFREYSEIVSYIFNTDKFNREMVVAIVRTTYVASLTAIIPPILELAIGSAMTLREPIRLYGDEVGIASLIIQGIAQSISIIGSLIVVQICSRVIRLYSKVNGFVEYNKQMRQLLSDDIAELDRILRVTEEKNKAV